MKLAVRSGHAVVADSERPYEVAAVDVVGEEQHGSEEETCTGHTEIDWAHVAVVVVAENTACSSEAGKAESGSTEPDFRTVLAAAENTVADNTAAVEAAEKLVVVLVDSRDEMELDKTGKPGLAV